MLELSLLSYKKYDNVVYMNEILRDGLKLTHVPGVVAVRRKDGER